MNMQYTLVMWQHEKYMELLQILQHEIYGEDIQTQHIMIEIGIWQHLFLIMHSQLYILIEVLHRVLVVVVDELIQMEQLH